MFENKQDIRLNGQKTWGTIWTKNEQNFETVVACLFELIRTDQFAFGNRDLQTKCAFENKMMCDV